MLDYQRIVEEMQAAVASQDTADWDLLRDTAAEYAAVCDEVNERLAECQRLLKQGLRSEAIQLAEREPNLLDTVALLDFPELEQWRQLLRAGGMVAPPALRLEMASELNAAYAADAPLQSLLKNHRLLALGRAPLSARIQVLRKIRLADILNPVWTDDLRLLETARHLEIQREFEAAVQSRNLDRATRLAAELDDGGWVYAPQPQLLNQAKHQRQRLAAALATEEMQRIEQELSSAYTALDAAAGRAARVKWEGCQQISQLPDSHPLIQRAAAAIAWLDEEDDRQQRGDDFARAIGKLENAIESDSSRSSLERAFHAARRFDEEIPPRLLRRYQERIRALEITARRRFILVATTGIMALILVAAGLAWYIYDAQREEAVASSAKALARLVDDKNTTEGQRYYEDLSKNNPVIAARPEIQQELGRLKGLVAAEDNRKKSFDASLNRAIEAGVDDPDRSAIHEADQIAKTAQEKAQLAEWRAKVAAADRERQRNRDQRFEADFKNLLSDVEKLERNIQTEQRLGSPNARRLFGEIDQLVARIDNAKQSASGVAAALIGQLDPLRIRVQALRRQVVDAQRQQSGLERITATIGRPEAYRTAIESFINENPESPLSAEFKQVLDEATWWKDIDRWKAFYADHRFSNLGIRSAKDARELLGRADSLLKEAGDSPLAAILKNRQPFLQHVADRMDQAGNSKLDGLEKLFDDRRISSLWMLKQVSKEQTKPEIWRYFLSAKPDLSDPKSGRFPLKVITGFDLTEKLQSVPAAEVEYVDHSPQAQIAEQVKNRGLFRRIRDSEWEKGIFELINLIASQKDLDPLLRLILLRRVVEAGRQGSHSLDEVLAPLWKKMEEAQVDLTANWLWPHDENANRAREKSMDLVAKMLSTEAIGEYARQAADLLRKDISALPPMPSCVGWLRPTAGDSWTCDSPNALPKSGDLYVLTSSTSTGQSAPGWQRVGTCEAMGIQWESARDARFLAGRPVFHFPP